MRRESLTGKRLAHGGSAGGGAVAKTLWTLVKSGSRFGQGPLRSEILQAGQVRLPPTRDVPRRCPT